MSVQNFLARVVERCARRAVLVVLAGLILAAGAAGIASHRLGISTDTDALFASSLPWRQRKIAFDRDFPQFHDLIVAVIDAKVPEEAEATAASLAAAMSADTAHVRTVSRPEASPYFRTNGLLFLSKEELGPLLDRTIDAQPFLGQLVADPSARGLFAALSLIGMGVERGAADPASFGAPLQAFHATLASVLDGSPRPLSWQSLLGGSLAEKAGPYRFVLIQPKLDYSSLEPGGAATEALKAAALKLEFVASGDAHVRITGNVPLADEEFATVAQGAVAGLVGSLVLITLWLFLAVRSWRLIIPILLTLVLGLVLTTGFAAIAVGTLNLISIAFAVLFVGIAVDFAIQFSVRFREMRLHLPTTDLALAATARRAGIQVLIAAVTTAAGFLAFVPTSFSGVAQLGLIAGVGMVFAFICTLTFLPAALSLLQPRAEHGEVGLTSLRPVDGVIHRFRLVILAGSGLLAVAGAVGVPFLTFDADPLHTKDPTTQAMVTLRDLMANPLTNPYTIDVVAPNLTDADAIAQRAATLPLVAQALTLQSLVPTDQQAKLALIADAASILAPTLTSRTAPATVTPADLRLATRTAATGLVRATAKLPADSPLAQIAADLAKLQVAPDPVLVAANQALTRFLPAQLDQLRAALSAQPVSLESIPADITQQWMLQDGRARVQITPKPGASGGPGLITFVDQVSAAVPDSGGSAVTIIATARTIIGAFRNAAIGAIVMIALILFAALRRITDVALVLAPLLLSALLTVVVCLALPLPLNFANVIALPLLLGVGVSFNIYFVMNWRAGEPSNLASPTARAVIFSALTTGTAFGSLALSQHPGTASMGKLLLISLGCTLLSTLIFVPALLATLRRQPADRHQTVK
ncbi:MMPL family transporter [Acidisphaera sp. L21]|uniref:MMPL family transporter n=1 Tax=Acidisphaera sp. L21 TaxID=1641851 RepID=UPI0020B1503F|nr:MMPL family transporter [Acidisphaera sp. L21]